jgi:hypothetical protein
MKKILFTLFGILSAGLLIAQDTKTVRLADFEEIVVYGQFTIDIKQSDDAFAHITIGYDDVDYEKISFSYSGNKLAIKYPMAVIKDRDLNITIYCPKITKVEARSGAQIRVNKGFVLTDDIITLHGFAGGKIKAIVNTPQLIVNVNQGGSVSVTGDATLMQAKIKTGGTIGAVNLNAKKVEADVNLGGEIICFAEEILIANVTAGGTISYAGNPKVTQTIKLGGTIEKL